MNSQNYIFYLLKVITTKLPKITDITTKMKTLHENSCSKYAITINLTSSVH